MRASTDPAPAPTRAATVRERVLQPASIRAIAPQPSRDRKGAGRPTIVALHASRQRFDGVPRFFSALAALLLVSAASVASGCGGGNSEAAVALPPIDYSSPEAVARSTLETLRVEIAAAAERDLAAARKARSQLDLLAAKREIEREFRMAPHFKSVLGEDPMRGYIDLWGAVIAYYADGIELDALARASAEQDRSPAVVRVPARSDGRSATIELECVRGDDGLWRVKRVGFALPRKREAAATQPAAMPEPAP